MNWKEGKPPNDFVGFAIEYKPPNGDTVLRRCRTVWASPTAEGDLDPKALSTRLSPIQKFRWVHFPYDAELAGEFDLPGHPCLHG